MTEDCCPAVFLVEKFVHEDVDCCAKWVQRKVPDVLCEGEQSERGAKGKVREGGLRMGPISSDRTRDPGDIFTSIAIPGKNIKTASAWKNFRLAFTLSVGTCLSAASSRSVATAAPLGR